MSSRKKIRTKYENCYFRKAKDGQGAVIWKVYHPVEEKVGGTIQYRDVMGEWFFFGFYDNGFGELALLDIADFIRQLGPLK